VHSLPDMNDAPAFGFEPLSPVQLLARAAAVHGERPAVRDGPVTRTYGELWERARRLAGGLRGLGVQDGDRVAVLAPNTSCLLEAHFGVPLAGAVLVALNIRLTVEDLAGIVEHAGARVLVYDAELEDAARAIAAAAGESLMLVRAGAGAGDAVDYEALLAAASPVARPCGDELGLLALSYTSGTTGRPKGAMYCGRGAFLQALAMVVHARLDAGTRFLWTLPMYHCNGWCFPWAVTAAGGLHHCLRRVEPEAIWRALLEDGVTHFNAAPTVLSTLVQHPLAARVPQPVHVCTGGAPPSPTLLGALAELGIVVTHLYGLTETYGPAVVCDWHPEWDAAEPGQRARLKARQGVANVVGPPLRVIDERGADVLADGQAMGEVVLRGNNVMLGYYRDPEATAAATADGWLRTGDLAVMHPDGYIELRDRAKDVIVSGGENIASIEVEHAVASHPAVAEVAVIGVPHDRWGETPAAFVALREGATATEEEIIEHARRTLAGFKVPRRVVFGPLPKTGTGKVMKYALRERAWAGRDRRVAG
jgi:fatty-acyl-CoA synthase